MKNSLLFIFGFIFISETFSQNPAQNFQKYQNYRQRLVNDYMLVGDCDGCGIPANIRGRTSTSNDKTSDILNWGDATIELGWYISVLATEYKVFTLQGQNTSETIKELYYALKAFNRLDAMAEAYCRCNESSNFDVSTYNNCVNAGISSQSGDLNGFFIRDDVPTNFVSSNSTHFNQGINYTQITNQMITVSSDRTERQDGNPPGSNPDNADLNPVEESVDQVCGMLMGCALVNKFIPSGTIYNGLALNNVDGNTDIRQEARNIADRIVNWIKYSFEEIYVPFPGENSINVDLNITRWITVNPVNHDCVADIDGNDHDCGTKAYGNYIIVCDGLAKAANKITDNDYSDAYTVANGPLWQAFQNGCPMEFQDFCDANYYLVCVLAALGNSWHNLFGTSTTNKTLSDWGNFNGYDWLPLLRKVLHGGDIGSSSHTYGDFSSIYEDLLNTAPANGPYKFSSTEYPSWKWSSTNTLRQPDRRGSGNLQFLGEYYGMDYMLLHNLYWIKTHLPEPLHPPNCTVSLEQPDKVYNVSQNITGTEEKHFKNSITTQSGKSIVIKSGADVWWTAGNFIELNEGFETEDGATAVFEIIQCNELFGRMANPDSSHTYTKDRSEVSASKEGKVSSGSGSNPKAKSNQQLANKSEISNQQPTVSGSAMLPTSNLQSALTVTPNPSTGGKFNLICTLQDVGCMDAEISVMNMLGEIMHKEPFKKYAFPTEIDISNQPKGTYFVKIQNGETALVYKVVSQ